MHEALIRKANQVVLEGGDLEAVPDFFARTYRAHHGSTSKGHAFIRKALSSWNESFADLRADIEILFDHGDRIAWIRHISARHVGAYAGFPASGKLLRWRDLVVSRIEGDRIAEEWVASDLPGALLADRSKTVRRGL